MRQNPPPRDHDFRSKLDELSMHLVDAILRLAPARADAERIADGSTSRTRDTQRIRRLRSLRTAAEWQIQIETGQVKSRAAIARREGISRAAVTQKLRMLDSLDGVGRRSAGGKALANGPPVASNVRSADRGFREVRAQVLRSFEVDYVTSMLREAGTISEAARRAKIDRKHFWRMMRRNGLPSRQR